MSTIYFVIEISSDLLFCSSALAVRVSTIRIPSNVRVSSTSSVGRFGPSANKWFITPGAMA